MKEKRGLSAYSTVFSVVFLLFVVSLTVLIIEVEGSVCGDGSCDDVEDCDDCPEDCGICPAVCGDDWCDPSEDCKNCSADCGECEISDEVMVKDYLTRTEVICEETGLNDCENVIKLYNYSIHGELESEQSMAFSFRDVDVGCYDSTDVAIANYDETDDAWVVKETLVEESSAENFYNATALLDYIGYVALVRSDECVPTLCTYGGYRLDPVNGYVDSGETIGFEVCKLVSGCEAVLDGECDVNCSERMDPDCVDAGGNFIECTPNGEDCCLISKEGICDPDCATSVDPDCATSVDPDCSSACTVPLYRFFSHHPKKDHFYTTIKEKDKIKENEEKFNAKYRLDIDNYEFEGIAGYIHSPHNITEQPTGSVPLHRFYSHSNRDNLYTTNRNECEGTSWAYREVIGYIYSPHNITEQPTGSVPLYRFYRRNAGGRRTGKDHFYTTNKQEGINASGYEFEGMVGYVYSSEPVHAQEVYFCRTDSFIEEETPKYCTSGEWCSVETTENFSSCQYKTKYWDVGSNEFFAYVRDANGNYKFEEGGFLVCDPDEGCDPCVSEDCGYWTKEWCNNGIWRTEGYCQSSCGLTDSTCTGISCEHGSCDTYAGKRCNQGYWTEVSYCECDLCGGKDSTCGCPCEDGTCDMANEGYCEEGIWISDFEGFAEACCEKVYTYYEDADGDGYGISNITKRACTLPQGYARRVGDCDDHDVSIKPGAVEICNDKDIDCDGVIDESNNIPLIHLDKICVEGEWKDNIPYLDWHDKDGKDWMSSVRDQGGCGSCWAFSALGPVEAMHNIKNDDPDLDIDLSEQELVSCSTAGGCYGGLPESALDYVKDQGILFEDCFEYKASDVDCSPCDTGSKHYISGSEKIDADRESIKHALNNKGPLSISLIWAVRFDADGIGRCNGRNLGGHAVTLTGYNDEEGYWIIKNSWGSGWDEDGYGKIGYGECNIETRRKPFAVS